VIPAFEKGRNRGVWTRIAGVPPPVAAERLHDFIWTVRETNERLAKAFVSWTHYHMALYLIASRYDSAARDAVALATTRSATDGWELYLRGVEGTTRSQMEIETFYFHTKVLLDRIARTFALYYDKRLESEGSTHRELAGRFKKLSCQITGKKTPKRLNDLMRELDRRVIGFRNEHIEHVNGPELGLGGVLMWSPTGEVRMPVRRWTTLTNGNPVLRFDANRTTQQPGEIIQLIEEYISEILTFFETYPSAPAGRAEANNPGGP
jgi:hypothetical protein